MDRRAGLGGAARERAAPLAPLRLDALRLDEMTRDEVAAGNEDFRVLGGGVGRKLIAVQKDPHLPIVGLKGRNVWRRLCRGPRGRRGRVQAVERATKTKKVAVHAADDGGIGEKTRLGERYSARIRHHGEDQQRQTGRQQESGGRESAAPPRADTGNSAAQIGGGELLVEAMMQEIAETLRRNPFGGAGGTALQVFGDFVTLDRGELVIQEGVNQPPGTLAIHSSPKNGGERRKIPKPLLLKASPSSPAVGCAF
jgi:hypothetical protein